MSRTDTAGSLDTAPPGDAGFHRSLGLFDSTMIVVGGMIGSGIFLVSADMARLLGSASWVLAAWGLTAILTLTAALSYGELAAMMPRAGGQYVYLREAFSPLAGFLYGWTLFAVIQTGTVAAVSVGFARYAGVLLPFVSEDRYLVPPIHLSERYAVSLSVAQLVGVAIVAFLTWTNTRGIDYGRIVQNVFTTAKTAAVVGLVVIGIAFGASWETIGANFTNAWTPVGPTPVAPGLDATSIYGLLVALAIAQVGSLFASDAWNNITFTAGEVKNPRRDVPLSLALGTGLVMALYLAANVTYFVTLPLQAVQTVPADRVAAASLEVALPGVGAALLAVGIMISTFGCANGMLLSGARAYYAMARDGLFFRGAGRLNARGVPATGLVIQGLWTALLVLPRTYDPATGAYGNLYGSLLDYVVSAALLFYILTIAGVFRLRWTRPEAPRPYKAVGYPIVPALYIVAASGILVVLALYRPTTTWPGFVIVMLGLPVYALFSRSAALAARVRDRSEGERP
ncbi:MAG: amino acid permease [Acidobacteria bacterium]|nr:amino acid permease [Acidobacteriota bacterium]